MTIAITSFADAGCGRGSIAVTFPEMLVWTGAETNALLFPDFYRFYSLEASFSHRCLLDSNDLIYNRPAVCYF